MKIEFFQLWEKVFDFRPVSEFWRLRFKKFKVFIEFVAGITNRQMNLNAFVSKFVSFTCKFYRVPKTCGRLYH